MARYLGPKGKLSRLAVELGLVADRTPRALQEQVGAFTAGKFGLGAEITCHFKFLLVLSDAAEASSTEATRASLATMVRVAQTVGLKKTAAGGKLGLQKNGRRAQMRAGSGNSQL